MEHISATELADALKSADAPRLLDVRQPDEHAIAAIANSRLVPLPFLPARLDELADWKHERVVVYCHHGVRSQMAIRVLQIAGFDKLVNLTGGIDAWSSEVDPAVARY
jgi:rhodanese-related sulfurtransferase